MITLKHIVYFDSNCTCFSVTLLHFVVLCLYFVLVSSTLPVGVDTRRNRTKMEKNRENRRKYTCGDLHVVPHDACRD